MVNCKLQELNGDAVVYFGVSRQGSARHVNNVVNEDDNLHDTHVHPEWLWPKVEFNVNGRKILKIVLPGLMSLEDNLGRLIAAVYICH